MIGFSQADKEKTLALFGVKVQLSDREILGIWQAPFQESLDVAGTVPGISCLTDDCASATAGDEIAVPSQEFTGTIEVKQPDGDGWTLLVLRET